MKNNQQNVLIIGAGLCGSLLALRMGQRGYNVNVYEMRPDLRKTDISAGRSINLAFSDRGNKGIKLVGLENKVQELCIPMNGRMLHDKDGNTFLSNYSGRTHEYINSISRGGLNALLLDEAEKHPNVKIHFNKKCKSVDFENTTALFKDYLTKDEFIEDADCIIATDGAGSALRKSYYLGKKFLFSFSQNYLTHGYKELAILPDKNGDYKTYKNALHIWPRGEFMVIALPNLDGSFTVTLFLSYDEGEYNFNNLTTPERVTEFFKKEFPDALQLMPNLVEDFFENPTAPLGTVKCTPWHYKGNTLLMGDSAHAIVPFYGQGMNASFEDVVEFDAIIEKHEGDWEKVFTEFSKTRKKDTDAIADLAIDNFHEMKDHVANPLFQKKRKIEMALENHFPNTYFSKYSLVTFNEEIGYREAMLQGRAQDKAILNMLVDRDINTPFDVNITVPADHILDGTGYLTNREEVFTKEMMKRYKKAQKSYDEPVVIVTEDEAIVTEKTKSKDKKTWKLSAQMVRDFGFATSRKFLWDMMAVKLETKDVMAVSLYSKEGNPLWGEWSTKTVASTLKSYSRMTFDYPYHKAISAHAPMGMEYPMISYNFGRPNPDGTYSDRTKFGMMSVIIHEVGHNWFPMIINSDERQWTWMDEGLDTFVQYIAEQDFGEWYPDALSPGQTKYPSRRGPAKNIVRYMGGDQDYITPIMTKGLNTYQFGSNAYSKPATGLNILRETVMGRELFDYAFKEYANRWKFKHPTPEDFFRTMEDASAVDLDWFWRGWFYTTDYTDIGIKEVKRYAVTNTPNEEGKQLAERYRMDPNSLVYFIEEGKEGYETANNSGGISDLPTVKEYLMDNFTPEQRNEMKTPPKYFYEVTFDKPGGLVMPLIVEYTYADDSKEKVTYPAQIWRLNDKEARRAIASDKEIVAITVDPDLETADVDTSNNSWPREVQQSDFDKFKNQIKN